jgi:hypothetical protein
MGLDRLYLFDDPYANRIRTLTKSCINLERAGYHAVDAGFWVVLELIIRWIRFQSNLIDLSCLVMFVPSPWTPIRLFSRIRLCSHE